MSGKASRPVKTLVPRIASSMVSTGSYADTAGTQDVTPTRYHYHLQQSHDTVITNSCSDVYAQAPWGLHNDGDSQLPAGLPLPYNPLPSLGNSGVRNKDSSLGHNLPSIRDIIPGLGTAPLGGTFNAESQITLGVPVPPRALDGLNPEHEVDTVQYGLSTLSIEFYIPPTVKRTSKGRIIKPSANSAKRGAGRPRLETLCGPTDLEKSRAQSRAWQRDYRRRTKEYYSTLEQDNTKLKQDNEYLLDILESHGIPVDPSQLRASYTPLSHQDSSGEPVTRAVLPSDLGEKVR